MLAKLLVLVLTAFSNPSLSAKELESQPVFQVVEHLEVEVPLSDGTKLATNIVYILYCSDGSYYTGHTDCRYDVHTALFI